MIAKGLWLIDIETFKTICTCHSSSAPSRKGCPSSFLSRLHRNSSSFYVLWALLKCAVHMAHFFLSQEHWWYLNSGVSWPKCTFHRLDCPLSQDKVTLWTFWFDGNHKRILFANREPHRKIIRRNELVVGYLGKRLSLTGRSRKSVNFRSLTILTNLNKTGTFVRSTLVKAPKWPNLPLVAEFMPSQCLT